MRRRRKRRQASGRKLGREAAVVWFAVALTWGYTGWAVYSNFVRGVHVHIYASLLVVDLALLPLAVWMTIEWRRSRV